MPNRDPHSWPAQKRLISPIVIAVLVAFAGAGVIVSLAGAPLLLSGTALAFAAAAGRGDVLQTSALARLDRWYARSGLVRLRLAARRRRRLVLGAAAPHIRRARRISGILLLVSLVLVVLVAAAEGRPPSFGHPVWWLQALRILTHLVGYAATGTAMAHMFLGRFVKEWDADARSPLCPSPVLTAARFGGLLDREGVRVFVWISTMLVALIGICLQALVGS